MHNLDRWLKLFLAAVIACGSAVAVAAAWVGLRRREGVMIEKGAGR